MSSVSSSFKEIRVNPKILTMIGLLVFLAVFFHATTGAFLTFQNIANLFRQMSMVSMMACGMVLVIVIGGIDLSVGKVAGFVSVVAAALQTWIWPGVLSAAFPGLDMASRGVLAAILTVICGVGVGVLVGMFQGSIIAYLGVPSFIVTLGGMFIFKGAILQVTKGQTIAADQPAYSVLGNGMISPMAGWVIALIAIAVIIFLVLNNRRKKAQYSQENAPLVLDVLKIVIFSVLIAGYIYIVNQPLLLPDGSYRIQGLQAPVIILAMVAIFMIYLSTSTRFGRYAFAIGGNKEAARLSGINIKKTIFSIFVLMGALCGVAGVTLASYVGYGTIAAGEGYELDVIASCILGGTSTLGGEGSVLGALLGALIMTSLITGMNMMNAGPALVNIVKGSVFILAVLADVLIRRSSTKS